MKKTTQKKSYNKNLKIRREQPVWFQYDKSSTYWLYKTKFRHKLENF